MTTEQLTELQQTLLEQNSYIARLQRVLGITARLAHAGHGIDFNDCSLYMCKRARSLLQEGEVHHG